MMSAGKFRRHMARAAKRERSLAPKVNSVRYNECLTDIRTRTSPSVRYPTS